MALHKRKQLKADYLDPDALGFSEEEEHPHEQQRKKSKKGSHDDGGTGSHARAARPKPDNGGRTRPTNNQLLYKAYFRWPHYPFVFKPGRGTVPSETDACPSVTAAFLQVLQTLHYAETLRSAGTPNHRSVLQILSTNTRRTKVVELSSGTHRVPDELKKHYLSDGEGGQYSTNLDRNRYGNDDNYLFTVIRYDLEFLGLCPCMVDVEIIDAKAGNASVIVSAGPDACTCQHKPEMMSYPDTMGPLPAGGLPSTDLAPSAALPSLTHPALNLPITQPQLQVPTVAPLGLHTSHSGQQRTPPIQTTPATAITPALDTQLQVAPLLGVEPLHQGPQPPQVSLQQPLLQAGGIQRLGTRSTAVTPMDKSALGKESPKPSTSGVSQLFDALVMAATGGQEGAAAGGDATAGDPAVTSAFLNTLPGAGQGGPEQESNAVRPQSRGPQVHHPPMRNKSRLWSAMSFGDMDSLQNALDAFRAEEEIASAYQSSPDAGGGAGGGAGGENLLRQRRRKPPRGNSSFLLRTGDSLGMDMSFGKLGIKLEGSIDPMLSALPAAFPGEKSGDNQEPMAPPTAAMPADSQEQLEEGGGGTGDGGTDEVAPGSVEQPERSGGRFRHVPRQASAINLSGRVNTAEVNRLRVEVEHLRAENRRLHDEIQQAVAGRPVANGQASNAQETQALQEQLKVARQEAAAQGAARQQAEEQLAATRLELSKAQQELASLTAKLLGGAAAGSAPNHMAAAAAAAGLLNPLAHLQPSPLLPHSSLEASMAALNPMMGVMQKQAAVMYHHFLAQQQALAVHGGLLGVAGLDSAAAAAAAMAAGAGGNISPDIATATRMLAGSPVVRSRPPSAAGVSGAGAEGGTIMASQPDATATPSAQLQSSLAVPSQPGVDTSGAVQVTDNGLTNGHHAAPGSDVQAALPSVASMDGLIAPQAADSEPLLKAEASLGLVGVASAEATA